MANVAINGLGRIGRATMKLVLDTPGLDLVAVNDLVSPENLAYLLRYDTAYGRYQRKVGSGEGKLIIDGQDYAIYNAKDPAQLPWRDLGVDLVFECTGVFTSREGLEKHLKAGARKAILSAPAKPADLPFVVSGVNAAGNEAMISCASCTTNCVTPVVEILERRIGISKAVLTAVHAYTSSQEIVDGPGRKFERGRAGACNLVPTSTGAAKATAEVLSGFKHRFDGIAIRAPLITGSIADVTCVAKRMTSAEEIQQIFREEVQSERYLGILGITEDPIVSADIIQDPRAAVIDLGRTQVVDGDLIKVLAWYDNEWGYAAQMVREAAKMIG